MRISASRSDQRGYSLLEVVVVVAIIATAMAISVPSLARMVERHQVRGVLKSIDRVLLDERLTSFTEARQLSASDIDTALLQTLPDGWLVTSSPDLTYSATGYCSGGELTVVTPANRQYQFSLVAGRCQISSQIG